MKTRIASRRRPDSGYALLVVLLFTTVSMIILAGTMNRTAGNALLNERNNQMTIGIAAAEAATEKVYAQLASDYYYSGLAGLTANLPYYRSSSMVPNATDDPYWANFAFSDGRNNPNQTYVNFTSSTNFAWWPNIDSQFNGLGGYVLTYRILSNVRKLDGRFNLTNAVQQDVQMLQIPVFQFAIFYNSLLEFSTAATFTVNGAVHANGDMYVGSSADLTFNSDIGVTGSIIKKKPWAGSTSMNGAINYNGQVTTNTTSLVLPIGTNNSAAAVRQIAQMPPTNEVVSSSMGQQRMFNKAQFCIAISNSSVTAFLQRTDPNTLTDLASNQVPWTNMNYFITTNSVTNFYDQREGTYMGLAQIDIGKYNTWGLTNATVKSVIGTDANGNGLVPNQIWIADYRTTNNTVQEYAVRLTNGVAVPTNNYGLTITTPNPLYVIGDYNCPNSSYRGTTNTTASMPCAFICDAITILSSAWRDSQSTGSYSSRIPTDNTTLNACIIAGVVYSTGSGINQFSGGVHNLPRLLEYWTGYDLWLNTSIVNLYNSVTADGLFIYPGQSGTYYYPPTRHFNFDIRLKDLGYQPPGTPMISAPRRAVWATPPANTINYKGI